LKASAASVLLGGVAAPFVARAEEAEFSYKYANNAPDTHPMNVRAREMAAAIKAETNGRFDLQVFPNNQLGSDTDMLSQIRSGGVEFFTLSGLILATLVPAASINGIGFAFADYPTVWKAMDGDLGAYVRGQITKANLVVMDKIWDNGFRQTTSSTRLQDPGAGFAAVDLDVQGVRRLARLDQFQRSLFGAADQNRRRPGKSAGVDLDREAVRSAEILFANQSHVGRLLVSRQSSRLGEAARGPAHDRRQKHQRRGVEGARRYRKAECHGA
jgi:hypothetical protein